MISLAVLRRISRDRKLALDLVEKDFRRLDTQLKRRGDSAIRNLQNNPYTGKPLRGELSGKWSLRLGITESSA